MNVTDYLVEVIIAIFQMWKCEERPASLRQANQELALSTRNVNHLRVSREAQKFHETRQFLFARGITYHMFTVSDVVELPCVHDSQSFDGLT